MVPEVLHWLAVKPGGVYVDATLGAGGHTREILKRGGYVVALDRDAESLDRTRQSLGAIDKIEFHHLDFGLLPDFLASSSHPHPDGVLADFGLSSDQLDDGQRGFSFRHDGPLDMRMDRTGQTQTAAQLIATASQDELSRLIWTYGEERYARQIARAIVQQRVDEPIETTAQLAELIAGLVPEHKRSRIHPATQTFQALRIVVNNEIAGLERFVSDTVTALAEGGRFVAISYHSLEDRAVKKVVRGLEKGCVCPERSPACVCGRKPTLKRLTRKPQRPSAAEVEENPRIRSARLRAAERLAA
jgi:16S rRNA (cytosine1402-N4)-methyltransferase